MMKRWMFLLCFVCFCAIAAEPEEQLHPAAPGGAFLVGEELRFDADLKEDFKWELLSLPDFKPLRSGTATRNTALILDPLPNGYYILKIPAGDLRFAVLPDPAKSKVTAESFFALDAALSALIKESDEEKAVELARRSGVKFIVNVPNFVMGRVA